MSLKRIICKFFHIAFIGFSCLVNADANAWGEPEFVWCWGIATHACTIGVPKTPLPWFHNSGLHYDLYNYQVQRGDIVWVHSGEFKYFINEVFPHITSPFVLVVNVGDESFPSDSCNAQEFEMILANKNIIHIFAQNCDYEGKSNKISQIPIGIDYHTIAYFNPGRWNEYGSVDEQESSLKSVLSQLLPTHQRKKKAFVDFHLNDTARGSKTMTYGGDRTSLFRQLVSSGLIDYPSMVMPRSELWKTKGQYAFSICPYGNGMDTHRIWEDLALGCICIAKSIPSFNPYEGLPVVLVQEWSEITAENLDKWLLQYQDAFSNPEYREKLTNIYWINKIRKAAAPFRCITDEVFAEKSFAQHRDKFSALNEEVILEQLVKEIKIKHPIERFYVDLGAGDGLDSSNTALLAQDSWRGLAIDADDMKGGNFLKNYKNLPSISFDQRKITPFNIIDILQSHTVPKNFGVLSLDIDGYDYFVLEALLKEYQPSIIIAEINEKIPPPLEFTVLFDENYAWAGDHFYGQSLSQLKKLATFAGYALVHLEYNNAFLVRKEICGRKDLTSKEAYSIGYQFNTNREKIFHWNANVDHLLTGSVEENYYFLNRFFEKYKEKYTLIVGGSE